MCYFLTVQNSINFERLQDCNIKIVKKVLAEMLKNIIFLTKKKVNQLRQLEQEAEYVGVKVYYNLSDEEILMKETLFVTDHAEICNRLLKEQASVLAWIHEENKEQNLGQIPYAVECLDELDYSYFEKIYRRFHKIPWEIAETKRCRIREMEVADLDALYRIYEAPSITRYMENLYEDRKKEEEYTRSYIENAYTFWGFGTWILERKDGRIIGRVGFNLRDGYDIPELGFVIGEEYQRQGYAYEACKAVLDVGKNEYEFNTVQALVKEENIPSVELCKKLGFVLKGKVLEQGEEYLLFLYHTESV